MASCYDCVHCEVCSGIGACSYHCSDVSKCKHFINKADFVEVVRCKNCESFIEKGNEFLRNDVFGFCEKSRTGFFDDGEEVYGHDFCSYGERKEDK